MTPDGPVNWAINWDPYLPAGDTISVSTWSITSASEDPVELVVADTDPVSGRITVVWLEGGTPEVIYIVKNVITTAGGITQGRSFEIKVKENIIIYDREISE